VVEASDNFETKFLVNDLCLEARVPFSHAGISGLSGQAMTVLPGQCACYRCVFGHPPPPNQIPTAAEAGVLGAVAGVLGSVQAAEAIKYITGCGRLLSGRMLTYDALEMRFREIKLPPPSCALCRRDGAAYQA
jgi:molybdopterin/thiamine biosynthesis adenylyltransferase